MDQEKKRGATVYLRNLRFLIPILLTTGGAITTLGGAEVLAGRAELPEIFAVGFQELLRSSWQEKRVLVLLNCLTTLIYAITSKSQSPL